MVVIFVNFINSVRDRHFSTRPGSQKSSTPLCTCICVYVIQYIHKQRREEEKIKK
jgi:hypothetical protein